LEEPKKETPEKELTELKDAIRRTMRRQRRDKEAAWVVAASERIQASVTNLKSYQEAKAIGCYMALPYEVQTRNLIKASWKAGKRVAVPSYNEELRRYELTWVEPSDKTHHGRWNINEPLAGQRAGLMDLDLLVIPALAFDRKGGRLGHGGGHYDRILGNWTGVRVGVAFDFQVFDEIPMGSQDIPVDVVVTERTVYASSLQDESATS
jgi:5-formyltetrahydrofolate cyclo-ligase